MSQCSNKHSHLKIIHSFLNIPVVVLESGVTLLYCHTVNSLLHLDGTTNQVSNQLFESPAFDSSFLLIEPVLPSTCPLSDGPTVCYFYHYSNYCRLLMSCAFLSCTKHLCTTFNICSRVPTASFPRVKDQHPLQNAKCLINVEPFYVLQ